MFNSHFYGVWPLIFLNYDPLLGGVTGLTGISRVLLPLVAWVLKKKTKDTPTSDWALGEED